MAGAAPKSAGPTAANLVWGGVGVVVGGLSTLIGDLGVKQLLSDSPFVGLAIFCLLAAFVIFVAGMVAQRTGRNFTPVMIVAGLMMAVALTFGGFAAFSAPQRVQILVSPRVEGAPPIEIMGTPRRNLDWETPVFYKLDGGTLSLSASSIQRYYGATLEKERQRCMAVITETASADLGVGSTQTGY